MVDQHPKLKATLALERGRQHLRLGQAAAGLAAFSEAIASWPGLADAWLERGKAHLAAGNFSGAADFA
jgi:Tetratricopeptide repeat